MSVFDWSAQVLAPLIPAEWRNTNGQRIKVALIDTGVDLTNPSLAHLDRPEHKFYVGLPDFDHTGNDPVDDQYGGATGLEGHGTLYASLLAAVPPSEGEALIRGIIPDAEFFIVKARTPRPTGENTMFRNLLDALDLVAGLNVDVAIVGEVKRMGARTFERISDADIESVMTRVRKSGVHVICALENRRKGEPWTDVATKCFPTVRPEVINVGALPPDLTAAVASIRTQDIAFLLEGFQGKVCYRNGAFGDLAMSSSGAVAIMGGVIALRLAFLRQQGKPLPADKAALLQDLADFFPPVEKAGTGLPKPVIYKNFSKKST